MTISKIFDQYLEEKKKKLAPRTFGYYKDAIFYMKHAFNSYGHLSLDEEDHKLFDEKFNQGIEFCDLFGKEKLEESLFSEFLSYFLPKKIATGYDTARKICGASLNCYKWLVQNNYLKDDDVGFTVKELREDFQFSWKEYNDAFEGADYF